MDRPAHRWLPVLVVTVGLGLAAVAVGGSGVSGGPGPPLVPPGQRDADLPGGSAAPVTAPPAEAGQAPATPLAVEVLLWTSVGLFGLAVLALLGYLVFLGLRTLLVERVRQRPVDPRGASQPDGDDAAAAEAAEMREAVLAGLADIDAGGDARQAVIACWLRLERIAAAAGTARMAADTPADLVTRLLARHRVDRRSLDRLATAYRRARYAPADVDERPVEVARRALREVDRQLAASRPAGTGSTPAAAGTPPRRRPEGVERR